MGIIKKIKYMKKIDLIIRIFLLILLLVSILAISYNYLFLTFKRESDFRSCLDNIYWQYSESLKGEKQDKETLGKIVNFCSLKGIDIIWLNKK